MGQLKCTVGYAVFETHPFGFIAGNPGSASSSADNIAQQTKYSYWKKKVVWYSNSNTALNHVLCSEALTGDYEKVHRSSLAFRVFTQSSAIVFARSNYSNKVLQYSALAFYGRETKIKLFLYRVIITRGSDILIICVAA